MNVTNRMTRTLVAAALALSSACTFAAAVGFSGNLDVITENTGAGHFAAVPLGTPFAGTIDDVTAFGQISGGGVSLNFSCCIAAGGLLVTNDMPLSAADAGLINTLAGTTLFSAGAIVDVIDLEGDVATATNGRIEVGLSYLFDANTFANASSSNYPFNPAAVRLALFFILEQDQFDNDIYFAAGKLATPPIPEPYSYALLACGLGVITLVGRRRRR